MELRNIPSKEYLPEMRFRLKSKTKWTDEKMERVIKEYLRYIGLIILYYKNKI